MENNNNNRDEEFNTQNYNNESYNNQQINQEYYNDQQTHYNNDYQNGNDYQYDNSFEMPQTTKDNRNYGKLFLTIFASFALGATSVFGAQTIMGSTKTTKTSSVATTKQEQDNQTTTVNAISKAKDAVVSIVNYQSTSNNGLDSALRGITGKSGNNSNSSELKPASSGSGVIYKKTGNTAYLVTNNHVIKGAKKLTAILSDGTKVNAEVVGTDVWTDIAVLKISAENVTTTMDFADSDKVAVGETAFAIGSPLDVNLSNTVTKGIVSAVNRQIPMDIDGDGTSDWNQTVIQTDAAINPGNSGGALINNEGKLIGINESKIAKATSNVSAEGIGFGIPSNEVKLITEQLEKSGKVTRPALGVQLVSLASVDSDVVKSELKYNGKSGVVIRNVEENTPASQAGLKKYDVITKLNGVEVKDVAAVRKYLFEKAKIGDKVTVTYYRNGKEQTTDVVVQSLSNN
ncbi:MULTISPECIES: S1C family serine protease [Gemella]|uniref:S1C family serine protease n=1 Tax=Gemella TaxID=1378 RepID=UPI00076837B8|nr:MULTISPECIES: trypsin-like peptidase domain-containing protein [Gemella]AME10116.1 serine protease [Gemella sp. oral taxon 928]AXI26252.1 serine protease [Gemella sp. ND 6198]